MNYLKFLILLIALPIQLTIAEIIIFDYKNYESAMGADKKIVFYMESTKAGIITTSFAGVVKKGSISFQNDGNTFKNIYISIDANRLDTDNDSRNSKMYEESLSVDKFPKILVTLKGPIKFGSENTALLTIRGKSYPVKVYMNKSKNKDNTLISGQANISLKALKIPDPSIWIASVRDLVEIKFTFVL